MKNSQLSYCLIISILFFASCRTSKVSKIDLTGEWRFKMDIQDEGISEQWYSQEFQETINLPGSMAENGKGEDITIETQWTGNMWNDSLWYTSPEMAKYRMPGNVKVPFWLTPLKKYYGPAWYQKNVTIPDDWNEKSIFLYLERPHWETTVWVDDQEIGSENYLATPHKYLLPAGISPGNHILTIRIDNRIKTINVGRDAHSISDNTQTNWNGMVGDLFLEAKSKAYLAGVKIRPLVDQKSIEVRVVTHNLDDDSSKGTLTLQASGENKTVEKVVNDILLKGQDTFTIVYPMGEKIELWDEFNPYLYSLEVTLTTDKGIDKSVEIFGMRNFTRNKKHFLINNRPVFLRGTLECAIFPLTGYPPTDPQAWERIYRIIKDHGLNHMRFHSWCPPEAAFTAADRMGVYLQVEASAWTTIGDGEPIDQWVYKEAQNIIDEYGNHPSFVMMAYGNEPGGENHNMYLEDFIDYFRAQDQDKLFTGAAGWPLLDNADYFNSPTPRIQRWNEQLKSIINSEPPQTIFDYSEFVKETPIPVVSHEIGQWCVYPNFKEMEKYTGVLRPKNFEIIQETLTKNNMANLADTFLMASGKLQTLCYKADIEAALRTKDFAGFQLLDLHDFPGQGTALVGVLDAFWEEKGYVTPEEFSMFCHETVPLIRLAKRTFTNAEELTAAIEIAHFGPVPLKNQEIRWIVIDQDGKEWYQGEFGKKNIAIGNGTPLGTINIQLQDITEAKQLQISVFVGERKNTWDIWVYPENLVHVSKAIKVFDRLSEDLKNHLNNGGKAILSITKEDLTPAGGGKIGIGFSSIFWNTSWTKGQKPHTLGILCDPKHPALSHFPTQYHSNWQWWDAMTNGGAIVLDSFPATIEPIVRVIDDWNKNRKTALILEASVGNGKLLIAGVDLNNHMEERVEARQLLYSLSSYMQRSDFDPQVNVEYEILEKIMKR